MKQKPNIIFIMPDQLRADFLGCYGADFIDTSHIDSLAESGVLYNNAYTPHPLCVPARVSLLTGMDAIKNGVLDNGQFLRTDYAACGVKTWPEILSENGYYTAAIGKMHFYPWDLHLGFQYRVIAEDKRWVHIRDDYFHFLRAHGHRKLHGSEHSGYYENKGAVVNKIPWEYSVDHFVGQEACRFIRDYGSEGPFAMIVGFPGPHCPYDPDADFLDGFDPADMPAPVPEVEGDAPEIRKRNIEGNKLPWNGVDYGEFTLAQKLKVRAHYAALVKQIDFEVGEILKALGERDLLEDTVIIFSADHGDYLGDHNLIGKGHFFESSIHIPMMIRLPQAQEPTVCHDLVALGDVTATILHLAGCAVPEYADSRPLPGLGIPERSSRERIIGMLTGGWMIFDSEWRLSKYTTGEVLLFNLLQDPLEQHNLAGDAKHLDVYGRLDAELTQAIMASISASHFERRVYAQDLSQNPSFGREGWQRPYPRNLQDRSRKPVANRMRRTFTLEPRSALLLQGP